MKYLTRSLMIALAFFVAAANAASPQPSGFLADYDRLVEGEYLEAYWVDGANIQRTGTPDILLGNIAVDKIKDQKGVSVADSVAWLKKDLMNGRSIGDNQKAKYRLDLAITHMDPGSAAKRILAGEFGAGHAQLQIEGKVIDQKSGVVVASFAERRRSSGAIGTEDLAGDAGPHIIEHLVSLISADIDSELMASFIAR